MARGAVHAREAGTVLLSTLLVLSLMSAVTIALLASLTLSVRKTAQVNDLAQADLYVRGAKDFALARLAQSGALTSEAALALARTEPILLPFDNGYIRIALQDDTQCFRLSSLADANGTGSDPARRQFTSLMRALGLDQGQANSVAAAAVDWVDRDQQALPGGAEDGSYLLRNPAHRTANVPFQSVSELRAVQGMNETLFQQIRPFVCIGEPGASTRFNINTADAGDAPVLAALLGNGAETLDLSRRLIAERPASGFSEDSFKAAPALSVLDLPDADFSAIVFSPERVRVEAIIQFGDIERVRLFAFEGVDSGAPRLTYEDWGWEALPPESRFWAEKQAAANRREKDDNP